tara:strand:- start:74 stop:235 length:162 start_codon:yes stop_codon:yes gene_type:complete
MIELPVTKTKAEKRRQFYSIQAVKIEALPPLVFLKTERSLHRLFYGKAPVGRG